MEEFSVPNFCGSFWKSWRGSPSRWWCLVNPRRRNPFCYFTRWKLHRVWLSDGLTLLCWFEEDVLGFETEVYQGSCLRNLLYQNKHAEETKADEGARAEEEQEAPVPLVTRVINILISIFSNVEVYINNQ